MGERIAMASGKGGTGKTSVCAGLATALAQMGNRVLCIDCDVGLRNLDIALGMKDTAAISFLEVCRGDYSLSHAAVHPNYETLRFLTAPMTCPAGDVDPTAFEDLLDQASLEFDYIFLDAPAGLDAGFSLAARFADRILLVTGSDPASIRDAARTGQILERMGKNNVRLIVNRIQKKVAAAMKLTVDDIMDDTGLPLMGLIPEDARVVLSAAADQPLLRYGRGGAANACRRIAKRLTGLPVPVLI